MRYQLIFIAALLFLFSCTSEPDITTYEVFPSKVDLISHDSTSVDLYMTMYIGPNLCYSFKEAKSVTEHDRIRIRYFAEDRSKGAICLTELAGFKDTMRIDLAHNTSKLVMKLESGIDTLILLQ